MNLINFCHFCGIWVFEWDVYVWIRPYYFDYLVYRFWNKKLGGDEGTFFPTIFFIKNLQRFKEIREFFFKQFFFQEFFLGKVKNRGERFCRSSNQLGMALATQAYVVSSLK